MARIFISYARVDGRTLADRLAAKLEGDHDPWLDRAEIQGGEEWSRAIEEAIDACDIFLALLTHGSYSSHICRSEQIRARRKKKRIVPLLGQAGAEPPIYLESVNYLDFSDPADFADAFQSLLHSLAQVEAVPLDDLLPNWRDRVDSAGRVRSMAAAIHDRTADWSEIVSLAEQQRARFHDVLAPRDGGVGLFDPSIYANREAAERELARFVDGPASGLLLIGDSGAGKTNLLCSFAAGAEEAGHAVLMYHCDRLTSSDVERELLGDLGIEDATALTDAIAAIDELARAAERRVLVLFDGINRFRGRNAERPTELLAGVDELVARSTGTSFRIALSCSTPAWTRMERLGSTDLSWSRYHRTEADNELLILSEFEEQEAAAAYEKYRARFGLRAPFHELPPVLQIRLRDPMLMRLFAETSGGEEITGDGPVLDTLIHRYITDRLRHRADRVFLDELVGEMHARNHAMLPVRSLSNHPVLGPAVLDEGPDGSYSRLLDAGLLVQMEGDGVFVDDTVRFAYPLIGAFTLAGRLMHETDSLHDTIVDLVDRSEQLSFAWETAAIMLVKSGTDAQFAALASSTRLELRELATDGLARLQSPDPRRVRELLISLLDSGSIEARRVALRAAYSIGPATRDLFVHAAMSGSEEVRQAVRDTLYLIWNGQTPGTHQPAVSSGYFLWRLAPGFTYGLMRDMVAQMSWVRPGSARRILRFVLDLAITIYVNHCDREDVARQTADLYYELTVNRLHLDRLTLGSRVERVVLRIVAAVFSKRILDWALTEDRAEPDSFFRLGVEQRAILLELATFLDPATDFAAASDSVERAFGSEFDVFCGCAALVSAVHAYAEFGRSEPVLRGMFDSLDTRGRLWLLVGMSVLLPDTPEAWIPLLEDFTRTLLDRPSGGAEEAGLPRDLLLLPLGLAYGKRGGAMPLFAERLAAGLEGGDARRVQDLIHGLGLVGFYWPGAALRTLRPHHAALVSDSSSEDALVPALATIRTLHVDRVDAYLMQQATDEAFQRRVAATADVALINRFVHGVGYYNNAVHYCVHYPRMRRGLGVFALELLANAASASDFIVAYAEQGLALARDAGFRLLEWTVPDD